MTLREPGPVREGLSRSVEPLRDGRLCFTSVVELAKVLTPENRDEVLPRFFHRSKREAQEVVAELKPVEAPARREVVTAVRSPAPSAAAVLELPVAATDAIVPAKPPEGAAPCGWPAEHLDANSPRVAAHAPSSRKARAESVEPLSADLRRLHFNVSRRFLEKLEAARDALSHSHPGASIEEILEAGLDLLLARHAKRKGLVQKPLAERRPSKPDHIPAEVKRAVWLRDGGRCQSPPAPAASAARPTSSSSSTAKPRPWVARRRSRTFNSSAGPITSSPLERSSGTP
ncbi:hypothetical protein [Anaeromyxobacter oryzisoli]|uniref:hypothetical protein n=1 Tax=Anaeromyxobacter oryzisoli TaxID=2925408 RepID=UPI001F5A9A68|nr:hypothetical protein [Anaeromyxobacter sp. SG63]